MAAKPASMFADDMETLYGLVKDNLRDLGVVVKSSKKSRHFAATPGRSASSARKSGIKTPGAPSGAPKRVFGRPLRDLVPNTWIADGHELVVPHFLTSILAFLKDHLHTEGIFRKAGSAARQKLLRSEIEAAETFVPPDKKIREDAGATMSALDAASLLKQWLRELPEPLITNPVQDTLITASKLQGAEKEQAILLCTLLLPSLHSACLSRLMRFLNEVHAVEENKMDARSLAIVFTPSLFPVDEGPVKKLDSTGQGLSSKLDIVELLIKNSHQVCIVDEALAGAMAFSYTSLSEDNLDVPDEGGHKGPAARRRKKKKRRSGSLSRVLTATMKGISKAISRSTTPAGTRSSSTQNLRLDQSVQNTPFNQSDFASPFIPRAGKRKVANHSELSPTSTKFSKAGAESMITPKVARGRSISIKNRFRKKSSASECVTPYNAKSTAKSFNLAMTPGTPGSAFSVPQPGQDLSVESIDKTLDGSYNLKAKKQPSRLSISSCESVRSTRSSKRGSVSSRGSGRNSGGPKVTTKKASPQNQKIGTARRRSREMVKQLSSKHLKPDVKLDVKPTNACGRTASLRRGQPNTFTVKPSPMKVEKTTLAGERTTRIKMSFKDGQIQQPKRVPNTPRSSSKPPERTSSKKKTLRKANVTESLTNLRSDISSLIEQSFATPNKNTPNLPGISVKPPAEEVDGEISFTFKDPEEALKPLTPASSVVTRGMRRQSSAFEFSNKLGYLPPAGNIRRQSSAFELAAAKHKIIPSNTSSSNLDCKNSSVKDLIKRLESTDFNTKLDDLRSRGRAKSRKSISVPALPSPPPKSPVKETPAKEEIPFDQDEFNEEWTDAKEFFDKTPINRRVFGNVEDGAGCKRSSILRIRKERKGLVSKNVETFTRPAQSNEPRTPSNRQTIMGPPKMLPTPRRQPESSQPAPRRLSARMGVASKKPITAPQNPVTRRQTLTGIRTTTAQDRRGSALTGQPPTFKTPQKPSSRDSSANRSVSPRKPMRDCKHPSAISIKRQASQRNSPRPVVRITSPALPETPDAKKTPGSNRKAKRAGEGRRYLTIGYEGEMRSPLKEKQNLIASVQRSKSAQTPTRLKYKENLTRGMRSSPYSRTPDQRRTPKTGFTDENSDVKVQRTKSFMTPEVQSIPITPKSGSARRLGDRRLTPKDLATVTQMGSLSLASPAIRKSPRLAY